MSSKILETSSSNRAFIMQSQPQNDGFLDLSLSPQTDEKASLEAEKKQILAQLASLKLEMKKTEKNIEVLQLRALKLSSSSGSSIVKTPLLESTGSSSSISEEAIAKKTTMMACSFFNNSKCKKAECAIPHVCSICSSEGHSALTCESRPIKDPLIVTNEFHCINCNKTTNSQLQKTEHLLSLKHEHNVIRLLKMNANTNSEVKKLSDQLNTLSEEIKESIKLVLYNQFFSMELNSSNLSKVLNEQFAKHVPAVNSIKKDELTVLKEPPAPNGFELSGSNLGIEHVNSASSSSMPMHVNSTQNNTAMLTPVQHAGNGTVIPHINRSHMYNAPTASAYPAYQTFNNGQQYMQGYNPQGFFVNPYYDLMNLSHEDYNLSYE